MKRTLGMLLALMMVLLMMAPAVTVADTAEPVKLTMSWWGTDARHRGIMEAVQLYMDANPHVTVEMSPAGWDGYHDALTVQIASGNAPDLFTYGSGYRTQYGMGDYLIDFADYMGQYEFLQDIENQLRTNAYMVNGKITSVPSGIQAPILVYNMRLFDEAGVEYPNDEDSLVSFGEKLQALREALPNVYGNGGWYWGDGHGTLLIPHAASEQQYLDFTDYQTQPPTVHIDEELMEEYWAWVESLWDTGALARAQDDESSMATGTVATGYANSSTIQNALDETEDELGFCLAPRKFRDGDPVVTRVLKPGLFWGISAKSSKIEAALDLLSFLQTDLEAASIMGSVVGISANPKVLDALRETYPEGSIGYMQIDLTSRYLSGSDVTYDFPAVAGDPESTAAFMDLLDEYLFEMIGREEFVNRIESTLQDAFDEYFLPQATE